MNTAGPMIMWRQKPKKPVWKSDPDKDSSVSGFKMTKPAAISSAFLSS
jgi:hypothetical protein